MTENPQNYGMTESPEIDPGAGTKTVGTQDEKTWSVLSHLGAFANPLTGLLPLVSLVVWLVYRDRSERVAFHALQSAIYQGAWLVALTAGWTLATALTPILIGFLLFPALALLTVVPFAHAAYAAYRVSKGEDYRYPVVADLLDNR